jgi:hypothetical protein
MLLLTVLALVTSKSGRYVPITRASFKRLIERRPKHEIWVVMLHTDTNFMSKKLHPKFINASNLAGGMFRFGVIDTKKEPLLARQFALREQPGYLVFSAKGQSQYSGSGEPEDIIEFASQFLIDRSIEITDDWRENPRPSAILFTAKTETPILWVGISHVFSPRNVRIGTCRNPRLQRLYGITELPGIIFLHKEMRHNYTGKITFPHIERQLTKFITNRLNFENTSAVNVILPATDFEKKCIGGLSICIVNLKNEPDPGFEEIRKIFEPLKYKWFQGIQGLPFDFMNPNDVWIYNPKLDALIQVSHVTALAAQLEKVADGVALWKSRQELSKRDDEF